MAIYVDDMYKRKIGRYGRMRMSHMIADTTDELLQMMDEINLDRRHLQNAGTFKEHCDVSMSYRDKALRRGAIPVTMRELASMVGERRKKCAK